MNKRIFGLLIAPILLAACSPAVAEPAFLVTLIADGRERTFSYDAPVTVGEFLRDAEIELGSLDRVNPERFTQITDGMRVTVRRVTEEISCERIELPYRQRTVPNEGLDPGQQRLGQAGQNGTEEVCSRVYIEDEIPGDPVEISRTVITAPREEIIYVGPVGELEPVPVDGTLAYINNRNAWVIRNSSTAKRPLTTTGDLDGRVFSLAENGRQLLFTREVRNDDVGLFNQLWLIGDVTREVNLVRLIPENILLADWVPGRENTISYSTAEGRIEPPGWRAFNDLWTMRINPQTGEPINVQEVVETSSGGLYGWWGTNYVWSPNGEELAWVQADGMGLVDLETGAFSRFIDYPVYRTFGDWSWRATVSWSAESDLLVTATHGPPVGSETPESSPAFDIAVANDEGTFQATLVRNAGIWSTPKFSPLTAAPENEFPVGYLAYLRAREPFNSINGEYDLVVADRDGSNARVIFPRPDQPGLEAQEFAWSPDGRQIAFIHQGNLWVIDPVSEVTHQLTLDGGASKPVWKP